MMILKKWITALLGAASMVMMLAGCGQDGANADKAQSGEKLQVAVSFDAVGEFVKAVGKDKVTVKTIIPAGTEPHEFEPTTKSLKDMAGAKVFVYNGLGMESWKDKAVEAAGNDKLIQVDASKGVQPILNEDEEEIKEHGQYDPHCWLSLSCAQIEVRNIADGLIQADPKNKDFYEKNAQEYMAQLKALQDEYVGKFQHVQKKQFVTGHAAFAYLCRDFGLEQNSVEDVFAAGEPSSQQLAELTDYCRRNQVTTIFAEDMVSPAVSETLAKEVGAKVEPIETMESNEKGESYLDRMKENLEKIYTSLK